MIYFRLKLAYTFAFSVLSEVIVVRIDSSAQFGSLQKTFPAELIRAVVGEIELVEAGMRLREATLVHVRHQTHFMLA